jgi:hypothetical protein
MILQTTCQRNTFSGQNQLTQMRLRRKRLRDTDVNGVCSGKRQRKGILFAHGIALTATCHEVPFTLATGELIANVKPGDAAEFFTNSPKSGMVKRN